MAYFRMSIENAISIAILFVLYEYVTEITDMVCSSTEQTAFDLADVAREYVHSPFGLGIQSSPLAWYQEGMQLFAFEHSGKVWDKKRNLKWDLKRDSSCMEEGTAHKVIEEAFAKWAKESPFTFQEVAHGKQPDIIIKFEDMAGDYLVVNKVPERREMDNVGTVIVFDDASWQRHARLGRNWTTDFRGNWYNFRLCALYGIGRALGLGESDKPDAVMNFHSGGPDEPVLSQDDIDGIRELYGGPLSSSRPRQTTRT